MVSGDQGGQWHRSWSGESPDWSTGRSAHPADARGDV